MNKRKLYQLKDMNEDERKFLELYMSCLNVNEETKTEMRRHVELYLTPFKLKRYVEMVEKLNPVPKNHPSNREIQKEIDNIYRIFEEGIVNTEEDFYSDYEASGMACINNILDGNLGFYYPEGVSDDSLTAQQDGEYEKRDEFIVFLFIQYFRTLGMRNVFLNNIHDMVNVIKDNENRYRNTVVNFELDNIDEQNIVPHLCWLFSGRCADEFIHRNAHLTVLKNKTAKMFFTSDQPVINLKSKDDGSMPDEFVLYYPLSPKVAITVNDKNTANEIVIYDEPAIRQYNEKLVKEAHEYIVSNSEEQLRL